MSCPECVTGSLHSGTPKGTETTIGGVNAYVVGDANSSRIIVVGSDAFGWRILNTRLVADEYAAHGFRVVVPDLFNGWELPTWSLNAHDPYNRQKTLFQRYVAAPASLFLFVPFVLRNRPRQVSLITTIASALRASPVAADSDAQQKKEPKIGFVGYCWGGRLAITQNHLFDATVAAHPSLVGFPDELEGIKKPFSLAVAEKDNDFGPSKAEETERILKGSLEKRGLREGDVEVRVYKGAKHGWTTRANLDVPEEKAARDEAIKQVVDWFEKYLS
ncbi:alpha/beta-hydrolase [Cubamyces lactineus]|nr:alpha/beta-hydrolase [Cubamyces lactineus]